MFHFSTSVLSLTFCSFSIDPAGVLENWSAKVHIGSWNRLTCSDDHAHILGCQSSRMQLHGCEELKNVTASNNQLQGDITSSMGLLKSLKILNLPNTQTDRQYY